MQTNSVLQDTYAFEPPWNKLHPLQSQIMDTPLGVVLKKVL